MAGVAALVVIAVAAILFIRIFFPLSPESMLKILSDRADLEVRNVHYREVENDGTKWEIKAKKASYLRKENQVLFEAVGVKLFSPNGRIIELAGDKGQFDTVTKDMKLFGKVIFFSEDGEQFITDDLQYDGAEQRLHTAGLVVMETPRVKIRGTGMSFSLKDRVFILLSEVQARIQ